MKKKLTIILALITLLATSALVSSQGIETPLEPLVLPPQAAETSLPIGEKPKPGFVEFSSSPTIEEPLEPLVPPTQPAETSGLIGETPKLWFVEFSSPPTVEGTSPKVLKGEKDAFRAETKKAGMKYTERFVFNTLWNGLSIKIEPGELVKLTHIAGVKALYPVNRASLPDSPPSAAPELQYALAMTGADIAQSELGYTGKGIRVAVMDSGIDYHHPDLGGGFGRGFRVRKGWDFVGDNYDGTNNLDPDPDPDPDDCMGHGTHVAGIIGACAAGPDGVTGVAPGVTFGAYKVFGCSGYTWDDIMIAAMERALADDMDILNMSIGEAFGWPQYPIAQASDRLVKLGMVVVAAIGNSGADGAYSCAAPGVGEKVIGVASFDNTNAEQRIFTVGGWWIRYLPMRGSVLPPTSGTHEIVYVGRACDVDPPIPAGSLTGKVALIERGTCTFREKAENAISAGAEAVVVYNNGPGIFAGTLTPPLDVDVPVVGISQADGWFIKSLSPVNMTWTDIVGDFPTPNGGLISSFSSYGLAPDLTLKPDIGAPGGNIYSTYPLELGGYATLGGTSMASPHVAGAVALLLEAKPYFSPQAVRSILQNSADPAIWSLNTSYGLLEPVHRQGAGLLDIDDAILATTWIEPGKLSLGESEAGPSKHKLTIQNLGHSAVTYDLSYVSAVATRGTWASTWPGGPPPLNFWQTYETVDFSTDSVKVPAGKTKSVQVTITPPTGPDQGQYGGYIVFTPQGGGQVFRVPYAGFVGDYQSLPVLKANPFSLPILPPGSDGDYTFTMNNDDLPLTWVNLAHQVRKLEMKVFDANSGKTWHWAYKLDYLPRCQNFNYAFVFPWDGLTMKGNKVTVVPDGQYIIKLSVLKALGDKNNPDHWETWDSPVITIDRP